MRHCVRCQAQRHSAWYAANRTQRDPFRKSVVWQRSGLLGPRGGESRLGRGLLLFFGRRLSVEAMSLAPMCCEAGSDVLWAWLAFSWPSCRRLPAYPVGDCVPAPPSKSITGGVVTSQTRPRRKQPPEIIMDLGGHPCREVSDALREAVAANQSKRVKEIAAKSWRGDGAPPTLCSKPVTMLK